MSGYRDMVHCIGIWSLVQHFGGHAFRAGVESGYKARKLEARAVDMYRK